MLQIDFLPVDAVFGAEIVLEVEFAPGGGAVAFFDAIVFTS